MDMHTKFLLPFTNKLCIEDKAYKAKYAHLFLFLLPIVFIAIILTELCSTTSHYKHDQVVIRLAAPLFLLAPHCPPL